MKKTFEISTMLAGGKSRFAPMLNPCTEGELARDFATAPALGVRLPGDTPLPVGPGEVEFEVSTGPGDGMPTVVITVIVDGVMAFHFFVDMSDPDAWMVLDACDAQKGFQVHVYHEGSDAVLPLVLFLEDGMGFGEVLGEMRRFCGQDLTARFYAVADVMCREGAIELPFLFSHPELKAQSSWILATSKVMAYLEGVPECGPCDAPSPRPDTSPGTRTQELSGRCVAETGHTGHVTGA